MLLPQPSFEQIAYVFSKEGTNGTMFFNGIVDVPPAEQEADEQIYVF